MAIEKVFISESNLIIYDEIMSQRLGLIPINADPKQFEWVSDRLILESSRSDRYEYYSF